MLNESPAEGILSISSIETDCVDDELAPARSAAISGSNSASSIKTDSYVIYYYTIESFNINIEMLRLQCIFHLVTAHFFQYIYSMDKIIKSIYTAPRFDDDDEEKKQKKDEPFADRFLKTRQIILTGEINKELADSIARQLLILDSESSDPIYMYIDSPGGDVDAGFAIYDVIRFVKAPVYLIGMGLIASAATLVLLAVPKEQRIGLPNSRYLIHQPLGGMRGVATDIEIYAKDMEKIRAKLNAIISEATGVSLEQVTKDTDRDYWLDAEESVKYGLISKIITRREELK